jgi:hypothetical protein
MIQFPAWGFHYGRRWDNQLVCSHACEGFSEHTDSFGNNRKLYSCTTKAFHSEWRRVVCEGDMLPYTQSMTDKEGVKG